MLLFVDDRVYRKDTNMSKRKTFGFENQTFKNAKKKQNEIMNIRMTVR